MNWKKKKNEENIISMWLLLSATIELENAVPQERYTSVMACMTCYYIKRIQITFVSIIFIYDLSGAEFCAWNNQVIEVFIAQYD